MCTGALVGADGTADGDDVVLSSASSLATSADVKVIREPFHKSLGQPVDVDLAAYGHLALISQSATWWGTVGNTVESSLVSSCDT